MMKLFVADTNALISYYSHIFGELDNLSLRARRILSDAIEDRSPFTKISFPSIVFVEIFEKWLVTEEFVKRFYFEVFQPLSENPNIELRVIDREVLENLSTIGENLEKHEIHDKLIVATAMSLQCPLISTDGEIHEYVERTRALPEVFS